MKTQNPVRPDPLSVLVPSTPITATPAAKRIASRDLFEQSREIEIDHEGRIYRLRMTQLNKLILTA